MLNIKYVYAEIGVESSLASEMTEEYKNNITVQEVSLTSNLKYADESKIHSGVAKLYNNNNSNKKNITVCVNAGHGTSGGDNVKTYCHPDHTPKVTGGTTGAGAIQAIAVSSGMDFNDGTPEKTVTLQEALLFKDILLANGYNVLMIRETADIQLDNVARTVLANSYANCHIAIHWDGDGLSEDKGAFYMAVPKIDSYLNMEPVASIYQKSDNLGDALIGGLRSQNIKIFDNGSMEQDLTQTSYSSIPSIDIELGNQSSDHSESKLINLANGLLAGVAQYYNDNDITYPTIGSTSSSSNNSKNKNGLFDKAIEKAKEEILKAFDFFLGLLDVPQNIINMLITVELGTAKDATVLYNTNQIQSNSKINGYVSLKSGVYSSDAYFPIESTEEGYSNSTMIPFVPVDVHSLISGNVNNFDVNFLTGQNNTKNHPKNSIWTKVRNLLSAVIHIVIYLSTAFLIGSLIWHGLNVVYNTIAPKERKKHIGGLVDFTKAVLMLVGSVVLMALIIFLADKVANIILNNNDTKFPYTVSIKSANYTFNSNLTGYARYMSQVVNTAKLGSKVYFTFVYFIFVFANCVAVFIMILRTGWIIYLSIIGPIIAALYSVQIKEFLGLSFKDWVIRYVKWASIPVILAVIYSIIIRIS